MDCSTLGFSVPHYLPEFSQIIVHWLVMLFNHLTLCHSFCFQSFPASVSFPMSQLFTSGGQSNVASAFASVLSVNIQGWFPLWLTGLIFLQPKDSQESSPAPKFESISSLVLSRLHDPTLTSVHDYWKSRSFAYIDVRRKNICSQEIKRCLLLGSVVKDFRGKWSH